MLTLYAALARPPGPLRTWSNLLAPFFDRPLAASGYPPFVWAYFSAVAPGDAMPRRAQLVAEWRGLGRFTPVAGKLRPFSAAAPMVLAHFRRNR